MPPPLGHPPVPRFAAIWRGGSRRQAFYLTVWLLVIVGFVLIAAAQWRKGLILIAAAMLAAGLLRALLPTRLTGWLVVRRNRTSDVVVCLVIGTLLLVAAITAAG